MGDGSPLGVELSYSYETEPLGSGLAVKQAARDFDGAFFVCNGDVITDLDLSAMLELHHESGATLSISLSSVDRPQRLRRRRARRRRPHRALRREAGAR